MNLRKRSAVAPTFAISRLAHALPCSSFNEITRLTTEVARACSDLQPLLPDSVVCLQFGRRALKDDAAVAHDVDALRDMQRNREFLLTNSKSRTSRSTSARRSAAGTAITSSMSTRTATNSKAGCFASAAWRRSISTAISAGTA